MVKRTQLNVNGEGEKMSVKVYHKEKKETNVRVRAFFLAMI